MQAACSHQQAVCDGDEPPNHTVPAKPVSPASMSWMGEGTPEGKGLMGSHLTSHAASVSPVQSQCPLLSASLLPGCLQENPIQPSSGSGASFTGISATTSLRSACTTGATSATDPSNTRPGLSHRVNQSRASRLNPSSVSLSARSAIAHPLIHRGSASCVAASYRSSLGCAQRAG